MQRFLTKAVFESDMFLKGKNSVSMIITNSEATREDLLHRISSLIIFVTPLRERKEDIPVLGRHFIKESVREIKRFNTKQELDITISDNALNNYRKTG